MFSSNRGGGIVHDHRREKGSSKRLNLPINDALPQSRINNSGRAPNSVAQNKSDLPVSGKHQQTEHVNMTGRNQRTTPTSPRSTISSSNFKKDHLSPRQESVTLSMASKRRSRTDGRTIGQKQPTGPREQQLDLVRKLTGGIFIDLQHAAFTDVGTNAMEKEKEQQHHNHVHDPVPTMEPEVDTQDTVSSRLATLPLHRMLEVGSPTTVEQHLEKLAAAERTASVEIVNANASENALGRIRMPTLSESQRFSASTSSPVSSASSQSTSEKRTPIRSSMATSASSVKRVSSRKHKKLTLSAYRKPEETVRLTGCDASQVLENEYNLRAPGCKVIGHGAFSTVRSALRIRDGKKVAIKSISKFDALRSRRLRRPKGSKHMDEWEIMKLLRDNPYVLTLYDVFETDEEIHLVTEFCRGGELFDAIKRKSTQRSSFRRGRFSESQAARITNQILKALVELHALGIVHRDIKAENILLLNNDESDIQVKLCDFGLARLHQRTQTPVSELSSDGELSPSTPGILFGKSINTPPEGFHGSCIGPAADIFSLGVTLYILLCGFPPVFLENVVEFPEAYWNDISEEAKDIVRSMLHHDPQQRISAVYAIKNAWIRQENNRVRRGSISANLELVRARLMRSLGEAAGCSANGTNKRRGFTTSNGPNKRSRISSLDISLSALYDCSDKRDVRVIEERVESRTIGGEERGEGMTCS